MDIMEEYLPEESVKYTQSDVDRLLARFKLFGRTSVVLELIASGLSEGEAIGKASAMFGVSKDFIRKFL